LLGEYVIVGDGGVISTTVSMVEVHVYRATRGLSVDVRHEAMGRSSRDQLGRCRRAIYDLKSDPDLASNPTANLNFVNVGRVARIGQLDGRPAGLENRHTSIRGRERRLLGQAEHVTVEAKRGVVVVRCDDQPKLTNSGLTHGSNTS
jgi:hypothetical protein